MRVRSDPDGFTLAVIQESLAAAADEMFAVLRRAAMSPIIYEVLDVGTGITDAEGNLVSSGCGIPGFVAVLDKSVKRILERALQRGLSRYALQRIRGAFQPSTSKRSDHRADPLAGGSDLRFVTAPNPYPYACSRENKRPR